MNTRKILWIFFGLVLWALLCSAIVYGQELQPFHPEGKMFLQIGAVHGKADFPVLQVAENGEVVEAIVLDSRNGTRYWDVRTDPLIVRILKNGEKMETWIDQGFFSTGKADGKMIPFMGSPQELDKRFDTVLSMLSI